jgi:hypothetical protein
MNEINTQVGVTTTGQTQSNTGASHLLSEARQAAMQGDRQRAYQLALNATQIYPKDVNSWLMRAELAQSPEETIICINRVNRLDPGHPLGQQKTFMIVQNMVKVDPFLAYQQESDQLYQVNNSDALTLVIPKQRAVAPRYPDPGPKPLRPAYVFLILALGGLMVAGLGAILFAPLAAIAALWANRQPLNHSERLKSMIVILVAGLVWTVGIFLGWILLNHFSGYSPV